MDIKEFKTDTQQAISHHPWEYARFEVVFSNMKYFVKNSKPTIIDVGCGDTFVLNELSNKLPDAEFVGIDIEFSDEMIKTFSEQNNIQLYKSIEDVNQKSADFVLLLDVLEHIEKDTAFLKQIVSSEIVDDNTVFIITVPAFKDIYVVRDKWLGHYRRYNLKMLKELAENTDLNVVDLKYFFSSLFFARTLQKGLEYIRKPDINKLTGIGNYKKKRVFDYLFKNILLVDYFIGNIASKTGFKLPGLSCMAVFTKREL